MSLGFPKVQSRPHSLQSNTVRQKTAMKTAYITILSFVLLLSNTLHSEELKASEVAAAHGMQWWSIISPDLETERMIIYFEIEFSDGRKNRTGSVSFNKGDEIKVFCWKNLREELQVSAYVMLSRAMLLETVWILQAFGQGLFTKGPPPGPHLLKQKLFGEVIHE